MAVTWRLPENEEVFESLASRVRPLTLPSEPVYHKVVFDAIDRLLDRAACSEEQTSLVASLRQQWKTIELQGTKPHSYLRQSARLDGTEATPLVSDTQLAAAWLYADLVHADAKGPKEEALAFPLQDRYLAAVRLFSHMAGLTVATLRVVESLRESGALSVDQSAWDEDVVVGVSEIVEEARAFVAPVGSAMPDMRVSAEFGEDWSPVTVTEMLRQYPENHVDVTLTDDEGVTVGSYEAAVTREVSDGCLIWEVLVAGSAVFRFAIDLDGEEVLGARFVGLEFFDETNALSLGSTRLQMELHHAAAVSFAVQGQALFTLGISRRAVDDLDDLKVVAEVLEDLIAIERLSGRALGPLTEGFGDDQRVQLRLARLMYEGHVVNATRHSLSATMPSGNPPDAVVSRATTLTIGGVQVPTLNVLMWHPQMVPKVTDEVPDEGLPARTYMVEPPAGGRFMAWSPDRIQLSKDRVTVTAAWDLLGIDEDTFDW